ncbi:GGDEF domain-containing protein [Wenzhouxiangella sp. XN79A]|uniref:diguanylate cyclase n=1 Tax=Wenzhouxiangella sp. XN79A TaxID=2724193 RepID=UPI00144ACC4D|nr:GGDEF domain-containing protein [Wenzhouxiangella sp. XN79A]NKI35176.1 GGDEF domain-containing protein [Wenzhouxiangella sp. XN79A]
MKPATSIGPLCGYALACLLSVLAAGPVAAVDAQTAAPAWVAEALREAGDDPETVRARVTGRLADADTHEQAFWAEIVLGTLDRRAGRFGKAIERMRSANERAELAGREDLAARAGTDLGIAYALAGFTDEALVHLQTAHRYYESVGDVARASALLSNMASALGEVERTDAAAEYLQRSLALKLEHGLTRGLGAIYNNLGYIAVREGDLEVAEANLAEALSVYARDDDLRGQAMARMYRAWLFGQQGRPEALAELEQAWSLLPPGEARAAAFLEEIAARTHLALARRMPEPGRDGHLERAAEAAAAAAVRAEAMDDPRRQARVARLGSEIARERGDLAAALDLLQRSIDGDAELERRLDARRMDVLNARYRYESTQRELAEERARAAWRLGIIVLGGLIAAGLLGFGLLQRGRSAAFRRLSETDALTGLPNRRRAVQRLDSEIEHPARPDDLAVAILDLDYFKAVNDRYGHDIGDLVLEAVATELMERSDEKIFVARFGGEEFIAVFNGRPRDAVVHWCESARAAIGHLQFEGFPMLRVTASLGLAFAADLAQREVKELTRSADNALYVAKREGRDRLSVAGESEPSPIDEPEYTGERRRKSDRAECSSEF